jgi:hypothetical protein
LKQTCKRKERKLITKKSTEKQEPQKPMTTAEKLCEVMIKELMEDDGLTREEAEKIVDAFM